MSFIINQILILNSIGLDFKFNNLKNLKYKKLFNGLIKLSTDIHLIFK